jgi:hypothetical protein
MDQKKNFYYLGHTICIAKFELLEGFFKSEVVVISK